MLQGIQTISGNTRKTVTIYCTFSRLTTGLVASNSKVFQVRKCLEVEENRLEMQLTVVSRKFILFLGFWDISMWKWQEGSPRHFSHFIIMVVVYFLAIKATDICCKKKNLENINKNKNIVQNPSHHNASIPRVFCWAVVCVSWFHCIFYLMWTS